MNSDLLLTFVRNGAKLINSELKFIIDQEIYTYGVIECKS